jgi:5-methyltetrahydropteroyltriglutamate--homocysteine methyltransferase
VPAPHRPPFRADQVGSLLRPPELVAARERFAANEISRDELRSIEDEAVRASVKRQEEIGLLATTDGEFRRNAWHMDFISALGGVVRAPGNLVVKFENEHEKIEFTPDAFKIEGRIHLPQVIFEEGFRFLEGVVTTSMPKLTIPSPAMVHFRGGDPALEGSDYESVEEFYSDLAAAYREEIAGLYELGCRYLQLDDTSLALLNSPEQRAAIASIGGDPERQHETYVRLINDAISQRPPDMTITTHLCRGNFRSSWSASGSYDYVAEAVFGELDVDGFFLEFDDERSGGFEPLRFLAPGKFVVLGLVTSKRPELEDPAQLKSRIAAAARVLPLDQLCLSPQCGFASTVEGNQLSEEEQFAKLRLVIQTAEEVWGEI